MPGAWGGSGAAGVGEGGREQGASSVGPAAVSSTQSHGQYDDTTSTTITRTAAPTRNAYDHYIAPTTPQPTYNPSPDTSPYPQTATPSASSPNPTNPSNPRPPNWPTCKPIIHHSISTDISTKQARALCRGFYRTWRISWVVWGYNVAACVGVLVSTGGSEMAWRDVGLAAAYFLAMPILSFGLWYYPLYSALRTRSSFYYTLFMSSVIIYLLGLILLAIGIPGSGSCAIITAIQLLGTHLTAAVMAGVSGALFIALTGLVGWQVRAVYGFWRV